MLIPLLLAAARAQDAPSPPEAGGAPAAEAPLESGPELVEFVEAPYPAAAKEAGLAGTVRLLIEIDAGGEVTYVEVLTPAGHGFDEAAVAAAWQFLFQPARDADGPVAVAIEFDYGFVLDAAAVQGATPQEDPAPSPADLPVNLEGEVVEMGTRRPLPDFPVQLFSPDGALLQQTATDADGRYAFRGVPPGPFTLTARFSGYQDASQRVTLQEGEALAVRLWARNLSYRDDEIVGVYRKQSEDITRRTLSVQEVRRIPGTFGDPVRVIQNLPGAARAPFSSGALVIRGSNPEDSRVYIDGIFVPLLYHLGGYVSVINADLIETVDYLPGGYGVRYGRSLGGAVDVGTQQEFPERSRLFWSTDALDSGGLFTGRVGKDKGTGVAVAARRSYIDALLAPLSEEIGATVLPRWYDYQVKVAPPGDLNLFLFGFGDRLILASPEGTAQGTSNLTQGDFDLYYGTHRGIVSWEAAISEDLSFTVAGAAGQDVQRFGLGALWNVRQENLLGSLRAELPWQATEGLRLTPGVDMQLLRYGVDLALALNPEQFGDLDPIGEAEPYTRTFTGWAASPDPFLDVQWRPLADRERLLLNPGVRLAAAFLEDYARAAVDPRFAARWNAWRELTVKGGTGLYHQPPQSTDFGLEQGALLVGFERAWSSEIGAEYAFTPGLTADVTVFHKDLSERIVDNPDDTPGEPYSVNAGIGRVNGLEVLIRQAHVENLFGWISYTLSRSERNDDPTGEGTWYLFDFDQTHILVALAGYDLPRDWGVSGKIQYVTGNPYTPYAGGVYDIDQDDYVGYQTGDRNADRQPDYFAVDLRVDKLFTFKRWQLEAYLDLLNVLRGENSETIQYNYDYTESAWIRGLPFLPSPGVNAELYF